jgi:hypothetical protein
MEAHPLDRRVAGTRATRDKFFGQHFGFGTFDCLKMTVFHVRQFGWRPKLAKIGKYSTAVSAMAALKRAGYSSIAEGLDDLGLMRIAPASVVVGDIVQGDSGDAFGALGIYQGNGAILGWHESRPDCCNLRRVNLDRAWSVL